MEPIMIGMMTFKEFLSEEEFYINSRMREWAADMKVAGWVEISPDDFLKLTTENSSQADRIRKSAKDIEFYNKISKGGRSIIPPFFYVDIYSGRVEGHEGRHRAAAVEESGEDTIKVAIILRKERRSMSPYHTDMVTHNDIPKTLRGQFNKPVSVRIKKRMAL